MSITVNQLEINKNAVLLYKNQKCLKNDFPVYSGRPGFSGTRDAAGRAFLYAGVQVQWRGMFAGGTRSNERSVRKTRFARFAHYAF